MRARKVASRLPVLALSPEGLSILETALTTHGTPALPGFLFRPKPVGPDPQAHPAGWGMPLAHSATLPAPCGKAFWTISPVSGMNAVAAMERACTSSPMLVR